MKNQTIQEFWTEYLTEANTEEANLAPAQRDDMKRSFFAGVFMIIHGTYIKGKEGQSDDDLVAWFEDLHQEAHDFFEGEFQKMKSDATFLQVLSQADHPDKLEAIAKCGNMIERLESIGLIARREVTDQIYVTDQGLAIIEKYSKFKG